MEPWLTSWHDHIAPRMTDAELRALAEGLRNDDPAWRQDSTTYPYAWAWDYPCEAGCAIAYAAWKSLSEPAVVEDVWKRFDTIVGRGGMLYDAIPFIRWHDDTPRDVVRRDLLPEVERVLANRVKQ